MKIGLKNTLLITLIISCFIMMILLLLSSFFHVLNKQFQNTYYNVKNQFIGFESHPNILLVELDQKSIDMIGIFPFSRDIYGEFIKNISAFQPGVIALDFLFLDASSEESDQKLKEAIQAYSSIVVGAAITENKNIQTPHNSLELSKDQYGFLSPNVDTSNNMVYSFSPQFTDKSTGETYEHFTIKILRNLYYYLYQDREFLDGGYYDDGNYRFAREILFPLSHKDSTEILIDYIPSENFEVISFFDALDIRKLEEIHNSISLQDKIILVGPASDGFNDEFYTTNGREYGMYIHANILNTLLSKKYIMYFSSHLEWLLIFLLIILSVYINLSRDRKMLIFGNIVIVSFFWCIFPLTIFFLTNLILNFPSEIIFSLLLSFTASNIVKFLIEDANKRKLNSALGQYVSQNIAEEILTESGMLHLDGEKKELVFFFSDIEDFTSLSEKLTPEQLVQFLREYLTEMTNDIMSQGGHIDKYEGDAIMAIWGAFSQHENSDYIHACTSALAQQKMLRELNIQWKKQFGKNISVRIGIHGGSAIVGNIGAIGKKMDFTALGDNVNLASRLEGVNKYYGTYICVSEAVYQATKEIFYFRYLDQIQVKGKDIPVKIYELRSHIDEVSQEESEFVSVFLNGLQEYQNKNFTDAKNIFDALVSKDTPSKIYAQRCQYFIENPPEADWDGIWRMQDK